MLIASILAGSITSLIVWFSCCSNPYNHIICQCFNPGLFSLSQEELAALEELSSAMKSGGVWVLSFFHGGMGMSGWPPSMWLLGWTVAKTIQEWKFGHHGCPFSWLPLQKNYRSESCTNGTSLFRSKRHGWFMLLHCWQLMQVLRLLGSQDLKGLSTCDWRPSVSRESRVFHLSNLKTTNKYLPYFPSSGLWCQHIPARLIPPVGDVLNDQPHVCFTVFPSFGPYTRNLSQALFGMTPGWLPPCHWKATTGICMLTSSQPANPS